MRYPFESQEAQQLNTDIFETIYYAALKASCELAERYGSYETYAGSPVSQGVSLSFVVSLLLLQQSQWSSVNLMLYLLQKLQSVQNAAAQLITRTGRWEHITPVLRELHLLSIRQRIDFKLAVLVHEMLHGQLPQYLAEDVSS